MNEEDKMPTYGKLCAENFRLEHNYRVVEERNVKLQNNWNELKKWLEENKYAMSCKVLVAEEILNKMQELEGNNE